jgi:NitT/TauT family transport system substrate-binding protein
MTTMRRYIAMICLGSLLVLASAGVTAASTRSRTTTSQISSTRCASNRAAGPITFISPFGYDASVGILDVFAALKLGYFQQLCLNVTFDPNLSFAPVAPEVSAGAATVTGEGSAADDLVQVGNGSALTAIATFGDTSDYALLTRSAITNLRQLSGKTLGYHAPMPVVLTEMLEKAGVNLAKVHLVNYTGFDPTVLIKGPYDALQAYQSNEPLTLEADGYSKDFTEWKPSQFGVSGTFNVQVVNTRFLKAHPGAAADFLRAELHAFDYCSTNTSACIALAAKAAGKTFNVAHETKEWKFESALASQHSVAGAGVGVETTAEWLPESNAVSKNGLVHRAVDLKTAEDTALAGSLYSGRTLNWPGK